jgi:nucleoside-diphosphate-sugar epimerase
MSGDTHVVLGTGAIGLALVGQLVDRELPVRAVNRSGRADVPAGVEVVAGDVSDAAFAVEAAAGAGVVYQCLNPPYDKWSELFPRLQRNAVAAAQAADARYVSFENLYMYGDTRGVTITEDLPYSAHTKKGKLRAEMAEELAALSQAGDLAVSTARASDYFGPRATTQSQLGDRVIGRALAGKSAQVLGDPDQPHSYTYSVDAGRVLATLGADDRALGQVWLVPNAPPQTTREIIGMIGADIGRPVKVSAVPSLLLTVMGWFNPTVRELEEMMYEFQQPFVADGSQFEETFGLAPTALDQSIQATVEWFQSPDR